MILFPQINGHFYTSKTMLYWQFYKLPFSVPVSASKPLRGSHCSRIQAFSSWGSIRQELQQLALGLAPRSGDCPILSGLSFTCEAEDSSWFREAGLRGGEVRIFLNLLTFCINCTTNQYHIHLHKRILNVSFCCCISASCKERTRRPTWEREQSPRTTMCVWPQDRLQSSPHLG